MNNHRLEMMEATFRQNKLFKVNGPLKYKDIKVTDNKTLQCNRVMKVGTMVTDKNDLQSYTIKHMFK